jgi:hypothetical protein
VQIEVYLKKWSSGSHGATIRKIFLHKFMLEKKSPKPAGKFQSNLMQIILA